MSEDCESLIMDYDSQRATKCSDNNQAVEGWLRRDAGDPVRLATESIKTEDGDDNVGNL